MRTSFHECPNRFGAHPRLFFCQFPVHLQLPKLNMQQELYGEWGEVNQARSVESVDLRPTTSPEQVPKQAEKCEELGVSFMYEVLYLFLANVKKNNVMIEDAGEEGI